MEEVARLLMNDGYTIKKRIKIDTAQNFKISVANAFLGKCSPWVNVYNPDSGTMFDIVGLFHADCDELPLEALLLNKNKDEYEIALRTMIVVIDKSIEKALEKIETIDKNIPWSFFPGRKVIIWLEGGRVGKLGEISILIPEKYKLKDD
ncbi:hypothetical protein [Archaeoglobus profundus]|uniref:Uncharacterized protein n=1 Tax=Archaeoglobus profundus (strain DSM 5631 / JCM 9629 / NBRC 100127 / Av18) TaxID=572546 RepID=D2RG90_ARCPA|nr:hypothetical protein [Archaeoglobus profundus]ADB57315.1 hypothetical protein Arcpr_0245 [Archaeoglobus profundus DSM 5631]